jgi:hypothetical protein
MKENNTYILMGIKNLLKVKVKNAKSDYGDQTIGDMGRIVELRSLVGERVCVDTSYIIYSSILAMQFVSSLTDSEGRTTSHILTILNKVLQMKLLGVNQVWIFDSPKVNPLKKAELADRAKKRAASTNEKVKFKMTSEHVADIQKLLGLMGVLYIVAPDGIEAEQYGALLTIGEPSERYCKYMISGDTDVLLFGGNLLRPVSKKSSSDGKAAYIAFEVEDILREMDLDRDRFVKMGLALGSDFAEKTPGLGPANVHTKARYNKIPLTPEQELAYDYFMQPVEMSEAHLVENTYDREGLLTFLAERGFNRSKYEARLDKAAASAAASAAAL